MVSQWQRLPPVPLKQPNAYDREIDTLDSMDFHSYTIQC